MPQTERFACAAACLVHQGEEEAVPQPGALVEDRLCLRDGQDPRQFPRGLQRDCPAVIGLVLAYVVEERLPAAASPDSPDSQRDGLTEAEQSGAFRILQSMIHSLRDGNDGA
jgi:hypothetical protein